MQKHRIFTTSVASVYPHYLKKARSKGRTKDELDQVICWLTGYSAPALERLLEARTDFETFFDETPESESRIPRARSSSIPLLDDMWPSRCSIAWGTRSIVSSPREQSPRGTTVSPASHAGA